jgi:hypothetical protein
VLYHLNHAPGPLLLVFHVGSWANFAWAGLASVPYLCLPSSLDDRCVLPSPALSKCFWGSSVLQHVSVLQFSLLLDKIPLCVTNIFHNLFTHCSHCVVSTFWLLWLILHVYLDSRLVIQNEGQEERKLTRVCQWAPGVIKNFLLWNCLFIGSSEGPVLGQIWDFIHWLISGLNWNKIFL